MELPVRRVLWTVTLQYFLYVVRELHFEYNGSTKRESIITTKREP